MLQLDQSREYKDSNWISMIEGIVTQLFHDELRYDLNDAFDVLIEDGDAYINLF